jgi:hypothetical protein
VISLNLTGNSNWAVGSSNSFPGQSIPRVAYWFEARLIEKFPKLVPIFDLKFQAKKWFGLI